MRVRSHYGTSRFGVLLATLYSSGQKTLVNVRGEVLFQSRKTNTNGLVCIQVMEEPIDVKVTQAARRTRSMRPFVYGLGALLLAAGAAYFFFSPGGNGCIESGQDGIFRTVSISGEVRCIAARGGSMTEGDAFAAGASFETGEDGIFQFALDGELALAVGPDSRVHVERIDQDHLGYYAVFVLEKGKMKAYAAEGSREATTSRITIETSELISSVRGPDAEMAVVAETDARSTTLYATKNRAFLRGPDVAEKDVSGLSIEEGLYTRVDDENRATNPAEFAPEDVPLQEIDLEGSLDMPPGPDEL